jgi:hypothetical protein
MHIILHRKNRIGEDTMPGLLFWWLLFVFFVFSLRMRTVRIKRRWRSEQIAMPGEPGTSPISQALANLLSIAGGIYLSAQLILEFLKLPEAPRITISGCSIDLVALISIWVAVMQPFFLWVANAARRK